jgi:hypothetical protein
MVEPRAELDKVPEQMARFEKQAARLENFLAQSEPKRGTRGKARQRHVTENDSAKRPTAHGVIQGDNGQALVDSKHQVIVHAEACGNGQDYGPVAPMVEGAKATVQAIGLPAADFEGKLCSADSHDQREGNLAKCAHEKLEASLPDPQLRARDPRVATQGRQKPPTAEKFTVAEFPYDKEHDWYTGPSGTVLKLAARRHKIGNNIDRRYDANAADCHAGRLREKCLQHAETGRKHLAVDVELANETLSQQMIAKIDTPEARQL